MRTQVVFFLAASICFPQEFWNGTRYAMGKQDLTKMFGSTLKVEEGGVAPGKSTYRAYSLTHDLCGQTFSVYFMFVPNKIGDSLSSVYLRRTENKIISDSGIECLLQQHTLKYGKPATEKHTMYGTLHTYRFIKAHTIVDLTVQSNTFVQINYNLKDKGSE